MRANGAAIQSSCRSCRIARARVRTAIPAALPELDVLVLWPVRIDTDPAQRWLYDTIHDALDERTSG